MNEDSGNFNNTETISMFDTNTNTVTEMVVADIMEYNGNKYLLVYESRYIDDDEAYADILKEVIKPDFIKDGDDVFYEQVTDDTELSIISSLFLNSGGSYTIKS